MRKEDNREKYKEYDHRYYIKHRRPNSKIGKLEAKISDLEAKLAGKDQAIESLEELNRSLGQTCNNDRKEIERLRELISEKEKENDKLIAKLEQQLQNAIVPKFEIGQEVFYIVDKYKLKSGEILEIQIWDLKKDNIVYVIEYGGNVWCENELFATKAEAEAKLRELQGEK